MVRTERELDSRRREEKWQLVGAAETSKESAEWRRLQRKNLSILGLPKRKEWPQCHRESSWQERRSRLCQKEKEQSRLSRAPDHWGGGETQGGREPHLGVKGESAREHKEKRVDYTVKKGTFQGEREGKLNVPP